MQAIPLPRPTTGKYLRRSSGSAISSIPFSNAARDLSVTIDSPLALKEQVYIKHPIFQCSSNLTITFDSLLALKEQVNKLC